jgi:type I restriction enzyme, S subunit
LDMGADSPIEQILDWPVVSLAEITIKIGSGATPKGGAESYLPSRRRFALVRSQNVFDRRFGRERLAFITDEQADGLRGVVLQSDDILLNITGDGITFGRACLVPKDILPACVNQHVSIIRLDPRRATAGYVLAFLTHPDVKGYIESFNAGGSRRAVTKGHIESFRLPLPPLPEQRAIARILGTLDDKIELNRHMNETLEAMAQAIFKDWFVDFGPTRAKLEGRAPYLAPQIWKLFPYRLDHEGRPEGWTTGSVYDLALWVNGAAYTDNLFSTAPDALPIIKIAELKSGVSSTTRYTNINLGDRYKIRAGELLFSWSGNPDTSIDTFIWISGEAWLNQHIFAVRPNGKCSQAYLYTMLKFLRADFAEIARNKQTTGLGHVTKQDLIRLNVNVANKNMEMAFEEIVGPLHIRFTNNLRENGTLAATRDLLLAKLMSGEIRVKDAEKIAETAL